MLNWGKAVGRILGIGEEYGWSKSPVLDYINLGMSVIYPSRHIKEAIGSKNFQLDGEASARFINWVAIGLLLMFKAVRLGPGWECGWTAPRTQPLGTSPLRVWKEKASLQRRLKCSSVEKNHRIWHPESHKHKIQEDESVQLGQMLWRHQGSWEQKHNY